MAKSLAEELKYLKDTQVLSSKKYREINTVDEQMEHIASEFVEEKAACRKWQHEYLDSYNAKLEFGMELIDSQYSRQTLLEILFTPEEIVTLHAAVRAKNNARGYGNG